MTDGAVDADDLERLEAALDRIAAHANRTPAEAAAIDTAAVTARLDRLIAQLQDVLSEPSEEAGSDGVFAGAAMPDDQAAIEA